MESPDARLTTELLNLNRQTVRATLAFPFLPLLILVLVARSSSPPAYTVSLVGLLLGVAVLIGARSAVAGMRALELLQQGAVTSGMRWKSRVNAGAGVVMIAYAFWREIMK